SLVQQAEVAKTQGDLQGWADLLRESVQVGREIDITKEDLKRGEIAFKAAVKRIEDAETTGQYLTGVLGLVGGILGVVGIGAPMVKRRNEAIRVTTGNIEGEYEDDQASFDAFKSRQ